MKLKRKINKEAFDLLEDPIKALYKQDGADYLLDVEDDPSGDSKFESERSKRRAAERRADEAETKRDEALAQVAAKGTDTKALEDSYKGKIKEANDRTKAVQTKFDGFRRDERVNAEAMKIATKLAPNAAKLLARDIKDRLDVDLTDEDNPQLIIKDAAGKRSALTLADLEKEYLANDEYKGIITGSRASGGDTSRHKAKGGNGDPGSRQQHQQRDPSLPSLPLDKQPLASIIARVNATRQSQGKEIVEVSNGS